MAISLHAATVDGFEQGLGAVAGLIDKAKAFAAERGMAEAELIDRRLIADMLPFGYQVKSCVVHSVGAVAGVRAGVFSPDMAGWPQDLDGLSARIAEARATLAAIDPAELDTYVGRDMRFEMGEFRLPFTAETFLLSFSVPNFHFHATTAYALLRAAGVPIGKRDYLGQPRIKA